VCWNRRDDGGIRRSRTLSSDEIGALIGLVHSVAFFIEGPVTTFIIFSVDPALTRRYFREVDDITMDLVCYIFKIRRKDRTRVVRNRIVLPGSLTGLGMRTYEMDAPCAFLGSLARNLAFLDPGLREQYSELYDTAVRMLQRVLPAEEIPAFEDLIPKPRESKEELAKRMSVGQTLKAACEKKLFNETVSKASGPSKFFIHAAQVKMAGDFLFASISDPSCRIKEDVFSYTTRLYLGIEVTPKRCVLGACMRAKVHPYAEHAQLHFRGMSVLRHNEVRDLIVRNLRDGRCISDFALEVFKEADLDSHGFKMRKDAVNEHDTRADLLVHIPETGTTFILDVTVLQPKPFRGRSEIEAAEKKKFDRYLKNWHADESQVIPLVFTCVGGWSDGTVDFLKKMFGKIANGNEELYNKLFTRFRYRVATIVAKWVGRMLLEMNKQNRVPGMPEESSDEEEEPSSESEDEDEAVAPASYGRTAVREVDDDSQVDEESEDDSPDDHRMELIAQDDDEKSSSSEEDDQGEGEGDSPDEQRVELTPPSQEEQGERSPSTLAKSAGACEVAAVIQSEQAHAYNTRSRARLLQNEM